MTASQGLWILLENSLIYIQTGAAAYRQPTYTKQPVKGEPKKSLDVITQSLCMRPLFSVCNTILLQPEAVLDNVAQTKDSFSWSQDTHTPHLLSAFVFCSGWSLCAIVDNSFSYSLFGVQTLLHTSICCACLPPDRCLSAENAPV